MQRLALSMFAVLVLTSSARAASAESLDLLTRQDSVGELAGWKSYSEEPKTATREVWKLDADRVLTCKGNPKGYLYTDKNYTNFVLTLQWRVPAGLKTRNGGVLIRMSGEHKIWPKSLEAQLNAGSEGDFWGLAGYEFAGPADRLQRLQHPQFGKLVNLKKTLPPPQADRWNDYEIAAQGDTVVLKINGQEVNRATSCEIVAGPILLTAEGNEIQFRNIRLRELP